MLIMHRRLYITMPHRPHDGSKVSCSTCPKRREAVPSSNASSVNRNVKDTGFETTTFTGFLLDSSVNRALRKWELNMG